MVWLYRVYPSLLGAVIIVQPETVIRWHRRGFRAYWHWKSRHVGGRPRIDSEIRALIRRMSRDNPLWGAPRIHGELLMPWNRSRGVNRQQVRRAAQATAFSGLEDFPAQSDRRHRFAGSVRSTHDLVQLLYGLVILRHARRRLVTISVTTNPTAEWIAAKVTDAFPWNEAPSHLIRDRDGAFGPAYTHRIRAMEIRDHPTAARSPWQNGHVERLIGSIRRESLDHLVVFDEAQLRRVLKNYASYYNQVRTHLSLDKNAPDFRRPQKLGNIAAIPILGGLHHQYVGFMF
jgi:transposase InsO family protein